MKTYSNYVADVPRIINNSLADNLSWGIEVVMDSLRYLTTRYFLNERTYTTPTVSQQQFYAQPPKVKKIINVTVTIGGVIWPCQECPSREYWDQLNTITFYQDFPSYFFVYDGQVGIFPIPSSAGNTITMHYKERIKDLSIADVTSTSLAGTSLSATNGATGISVTSGATGVFSSWMASDGWVRLSPSTSAGVTGPNGDNVWYQIASVTSAATAVLKAPYEGSTVTGASYTIGQVPILPEDYQDLPLYRLGIIYYTTRFPDAVRAAEYQKLWDEGFKALNDEFGSKSTSVVLADTDQPQLNPNLFQSSIS